MQNELSKKVITELQAIPINLQRDILLEVVEDIFNYVENNHYLHNKDLLFAEQFENISSNYSDFMQDLRDAKKRTNR